MIEQSQSVAAKRSLAGETAAHRQLKYQAVAWASAQGYRAVGLEVRLPRSRYRVDVAAYRHSRPTTMTAVFECKQSRADFLKDAHSVDRATEKLKQLEARRLTLERLLRVHEPSLRKGDSLFAEYDSLDTDRLQHHTYQKVRREIEVLQNRLYGKTKFEKIIRYACANLNYLVVTEGIIAPHELPAGWGMLVQRDGALTLKRRPVFLPVEEPVRVQFLHAIAIAGTRYCRRAMNDAKV